MSRTKLVLIALLFILIGLASGLGIIYLYRTNVPTAGLKIDSDPPALVYINNQSEGMTPFNKTFPPGEISLRLIPQSNSPLPEFRTQLPLTAKTFSYVSRRFSSTGSSGVSLYFQPSTASETSVQVISSVPESVFVSFDGQSQGSSPLTISPVLPGDHQLLLTSVGFQSRNLLIRVLEGHRLIAQSQLEPIALPSPAPPVSPPESSPSATSSASRVTILSTPTGYLRVRSGPSSVSAEIGKIYPGQIFPLISTSSGWVQLDLGKTASPSSGWVSSGYTRTVTP